jgi:hypothetical protein
MVMMFWVLGPSGLVHANVSEKHTASIFMAEVTEMERGGIIQNNRKRGRRRRRTLSAFIPLNRRLYQWFPTIFKYLFAEINLLKYTKMHFSI